MQTVYRHRLPAVLSTNFYLTMATALLALAGSHSAWAQTAAPPPQLGKTAINSPASELFGEQAPDTAGWQGLSRLLEALAPKVDTSLPLSPSQITDRIALMINNGQYQEALEVIARREAQLAAARSVGNDVQLQFLRARAHSGLAEHNEAVRIYLDMTSSYPELPEPWNNLAAEYVALGQLERARDALEMALTAHPEYAPALANMGRVQLMLAEQSFRRAEALGLPADETSSLKR